MIGSVIFLMVLGLVIFKMVYDHQIVKDKLKMVNYGQEEKEGFEKPVSRKSSTRKPRGKNAGEQQLL